MKVLRITIDLEGYDADRVERNLAIINGRLDATGKPRLEMEHWARRCLLAGCHDVEHRLCLESGGRNPHQQALDDWMEPRRTGALPDEGEVT